MFSNGKRSLVWTFDSASDSITSVIDPAEVIYCAHLGDTLVNVIFRGGGTLTFGHSSEKMALDFVKRIKEAMCS